MKSERLTRIRKLGRRLQEFILLGFGVLLWTHLSKPNGFVLDELYYIPAAKTLVTQFQDLNTIHPPLGKAIYGLSWLVLSEWSKLMSPLVAFRFAASCFGLLALWALRRILRRFEFSELDIAAATCLTGFNVLWFVQSKIAMLDILYVAVALTAVSLVIDPSARRFTWVLGWILFGFAGAIKWAAACLLIPTVLWLVFSADAHGMRRFQGMAMGLSISVCTYLLAILPLLFHHDLSTFEYHHRLFELSLQTGSVSHPYASHWYEWPTLLRPMWYAFETNRSGFMSHPVQAIWAGGNPLLFWTALPCSLIVLTGAFRWKYAARTARFLALFYSFSLMFFAALPRNTQFYYYYLPASLFLGPIVVWAFRDRFGSTVKSNWSLAGFVMLCGLLFLYFLPILDGRPIPPNQHHLYMWLSSWI